MNKNAVFKGFEVFDHHREFINKSAQSSIGKFERAKAFQVNVMVRRLEHGAKNNQDSFECEISVNGDFNSKNIFQKKNGSNFYNTVRGAFKAVEQSLRKESKTRITKKKNSYNKFVMKQEEIAE